MVIGLLLHHLVMQYELVLVLEDADLDAQFHRDARFSLADPLGVRLKNREHLLLAFSAANWTPIPPQTDHQCGVSKASRYEPDINPTYQDLASHYDVAVLPARACKPKDKAGVSAESLRGQAAVIGPRTETVVERLLHQRRHPQQAFRSCLGVLQLGSARLEGCMRASPQAQRGQLEELAIDPQARLGPAAAGRTPARARPAGA
jgi:hypothetical protein